MRTTIIAAIAATVLFGAAGAAQAQAKCGDTAGSNGAAPAAALSGTKWTGSAVWNDADSQTMTVTLRADCSVAYAYEGESREYTNGTWLQRGTLVMWQTNDHFAVYIGQQEAGALSGQMTNRQGFRGFWAFKPVTR